MTASLMAVGAALRARRHRRADSRWGAQMNDLGDKKSRHLEELQTKKGEQSSPKVSLKPLSAGSKLWIRFQTTFRDVGTFVLFFLGDADWCNEPNDLERHEGSNENPTKNRRRTNQLT